MCYSARPVQSLLIHYLLIFKWQPGGVRGRIAWAPVEALSRQRNTVGHNKAAPAGAAVHFPPLNVSFRDSSLTHKLCLRRIFRGGAGAESLLCNVK